MKYCYALMYLLFACRTPMSTSAAKEDDLKTSKSGFDMAGIAQSCVPAPEPYSVCAKNTVEQQKRIDTFATSCVDAGFAVIRCAPAELSVCGEILCDGNLKNIHRQTGYDINGKLQNCVPYKGPKRLCEPVTAEYIKRSTDFQKRCTDAGFATIGCVDAPDCRCGGVACSGLPKPAPLN